MNQFFCEQSKDDIILLQYLLEVNIIFELISFKKDIFKHVLDFLSVFDLSKLDRAILNKDIRVIFLNLKKKIFLSSKKNNQVLYVDNILINWLKTRNIEVDTFTITNQIMFNRFDNKFNTVFNFLQYFNSLTEYFHSNLFGNDFLQIVYCNNPNIECTHIYFDDFIDDNEEEEYYNEDDDDVITYLNNNHQERVEKIFLNILPYCKNLEKLSLSCENYVPSSYDFIENLGFFCPKLKILKLENLININGDIFEKIVSKLINLETIHITYNILLTNDNLIKGLQNCKKIKEIKLCKNSFVNSSFLITLSNYFKLEKIDTVSLFNNNQEFITFCHLNNKLKHINISFSSAINNDSMIECWIDCPMLEYINIRHTSVNLNFLLNYRIFNINKPHIFKSCTILVDKNQITEDWAFFSCVLKQYFINLNIV